MGDAQAGMGAEELSVSVEVQFGKYGIRSDSEVANYQL